MPSHPRLGVIALIAAAAALHSTPTLAQADADGQSGPWRYRASLHLYLPSVSGSTSMPVNGGGTIDVDADKILDALQGVFMGSFDAHNGRWGIFTDLLYVKLGNDVSNSRDFTIGGAGLPAGTSANLDLEMKGLVWTLAGQYRVLYRPGLAVDLLGGFRMTKVETSLRWDISGSLGSLPPTARSGGSDVTDTLWDGIVGVRGRYVLPQHPRWSVPFYLDVGAGDSKLTWQAATGLAYSFSWGELAATWRYLAYDMDSGRALRDLSFSGPMLTASFHF